MRNLVLASLMTFTIFSSACFAQNDKPNNLSYTGWSWSGHLDHVNIDSESALREGIEDSATVIGGAAEYYSSESSNTLSLGLSFMFYRDNEAFAQYVEDYYGGADYTESDANAFMIFAEYGPVYRFGANKSSFFTARAGVSGILASERGIGYCSDCYSEKIDIKGGAYGVLGIGQTLGAFDISLQFQQYFSGDLDNSLRLKIAGTF